MLRVMFLIHKSKRAKAQLHVVLTVADDDATSPSASAAVEGGGDPKSEGRAGEVGGQMTTEADVDQDQKLVRCTVNRGEMADFIFSKGHNFNFSFDYAPNKN